MLYAFQPRSTRSIIRVQGHILRAGEEIDLLRRPRKGHLRAGLVALEGGTPFEERIRPEVVPTPPSTDGAEQDPRYGLAPQKDATNWRTLHWRRRCKLAKALGQNFGTDHALADHYIRSLKLDAVKAEIERQGW